MKDTVAHTPLPHTILPHSATSSFDLANILTLCTRPYLLKCSRIFSSRILSGRFPTQRWRVSLTIMSPTLHHSGTRPNTEIAHNDSTAVRRIRKRTHNTHTNESDAGDDGNKNKYFTQTSRPDTRALLGDTQRTARSTMVAKPCTNFRAYTTHTTQIRCVYININ